jgi:myo-inositol 2-dehydrogenase / D-chiro-inositol 1-dehydrogenase
MTERVAIIGCGRMGHERARAAMNCGAVVRAVVDPDLSRAAELAAATGALACARVQDFPWSSLDAVFLCAPPSYRHEPIALAVRHGVNVFVEKPFALNARSADELAALVDGSSINAGVGYMNRYRSSVTLAKEFAQHEDFIGVNMVWAGKRYGVPWWSLAEQSGGPINEQATHFIDLLRFLRGEIRHVQSIIHSGETRLALAAEFDEGGFATLLYTCEAPEKDIAIHVLTQRGHLTLSGWDLLPTSNTIDGRLPAPGISPFQSETEAFLKGHTRCDFADASRTQALVERVRSAALVS